MTISPQCLGCRDSVLATGSKCACSVKLRIRSPEELDQQADGLFEVISILEQVGIRFFVAEGTLLGFHRDGNFIPWDWDVGINIMHEDFAGRADALVSRLQKGDFEVFRKKGRNAKVNAWKNGAKYELTVWKKRGRMRARAGRRVPSIYFENAGTVSFRGKLLPCPGPPASYLEHQYGDWQTPKRSLSTASSQSQSKWRRTKVRLLKLVK